MCDTPGFVEAAYAADRAAVSTETPWMQDEHSAEIVPDPLESWTLENFADLLPARSACHEM